MSMVKTNDGKKTCSSQGGQLQKVNDDQVHLYLTKQETVKTMKPVAMISHNEAQLLGSESPNHEVSGLTIYRI